MIHLHYLLIYLYIILLITLQNRFLQIGTFSVISASTNRSAYTNIHSSSNHFYYKYNHTHPKTHPTTSRTLSRPTLPLIATNPHSYNPFSTNLNNIQQPSTVSNTQSNTLKSNSFLSTSQIPQFHSFYERIHIFIQPNFFLLWYENI